MFDKTQVVRCEFDLPSGKVDQAIKTDEKTGDVRFDALALDKKRKPNRKGFVFDWKSPADVDVTPLQQNGRLYWMHETYAPPIGFIETVTVTKTQVKIRGMIPGDSRFDESFLDTEAMAKLREVRGMVQSGLVKAVSIGFYVHEYEEVQDPKNPDVWYIRILKLEIIEVSVVTIGAHETALIQGVTCQADSKWSEKLDMGEDDFVKTLNVDRELVCLGFEEPKWVQAKDGETHAINLSNGKKPKLVHHKDGELDRDAVMQSMAIVLGARNGLAGVDDGGRDAAYRHLCAHYGELEMEPPEQYESQDDTIEAYLEQLHQQGVIRIPGAKTPASMEEMVQQAVDSKMIEMFAKVCEALEQQKEAMERLEAALAERDTTLQQKPAEETPQEIEVDVDALRQTIRKQLRIDPELKRLRDMRTELALENMRNKNRR